MTKIASTTEAGTAASCITAGVTSEAAAATGGAGDSGAMKARAFRHTGRLLAVTALASLVLSACGTQETGGSAGERPKSAAGAAAAVTGHSASAPLAAFTRMLDEVARGCPSDPASRRGSVMDNAPEPTETVTPLPEGFVEPREDSGQPGIELSPYEWCAGHRHVERVTQAVAALEKPTPELVRATLNDFGYIDERILGPERSDGKTRFVLDLRVDGGELCVWGEVGRGVPYVELFADTDAEPSFSPDPRWAPQD
jgi:hypothetical protein